MCAAEMVGTAMVPGFEQDLVAHLNDVCSDRSSPEYQKYRKYIPGMAKLLGEKFKLRFVRTYMQENGPVKLNESLDELFDMLGCWWLKYDQFEEALEAFKTCVEISEREGCWWPQKICARYAHLAFAHMSLGNKPEQLRASIQAVAFAIIGAKNISYSSSHECSRKLFRASLVNLAAQFVGRIPDGPSLKNASTVNHVQVYSLSLRATLTDARPVRILNLLVCRRLRPVLWMVLITRSTNPVFQAQCAFLWRMMD